MYTLRPFGNAGTGNISKETTEFGIFSTKGARPSASGYAIVLTVGGATLAAFFGAAAFEVLAFGGTDFAFADV
jgi:hypothetical protein